MLINGNQIPPVDPWLPACFANINFDNPSSINQIVGFLGNERTVTAYELIKAVTTYAIKLEAVSCRGWAIYCEDSIHFIIALLAALKTQLDIVIIPNKQSETINDLVKQRYIILTDVELDQAINPSYIAVDLDSLVSTAVIAKEAQYSFLVNRQRKLFFYTSGTTGKPKLVAKQFRQLMDEVTVLHELWEKQAEGAVFLSTVSHQHIYGFLFKILWPLTIGRPIISRLISYPEELLVVSQQFEKVLWVASPALLKRLLEAIDTQVTSLSMIVSSGGALDYPTASQIASKLNHLPIEVLGSTETGGVAWRQQSQIKSPWTPLPRCTITKDIETGCLQVSSPFITAQQCSLLMGDIIELLANGQFLLGERADRIVKIEEKRLSLAQLETVLQGCEEVSQVASVALLDGARAKVGVVVVLTETGQGKLQQLGKRQLNLHFTQFLSRYFERTLLPKKWRYVSELPENNQGKVSANALMQLF